MLKFFKDFHIQPVTGGVEPTPSQEPTVNTGYTIIGGATDDDGVITVASGKFVTTNININFSEYDSWAIVSKIYFMSGSYPDNGFMGLLNFDNKTCLNSYIKNTGKLFYALSSNGTSYDIAGIGTFSTIGNLPTNAWCYVKLEFTGSSYNLYYGTSLDNMTLQATINSSTKVYSKSGVYVWGKDESPSGIVPTSSKFDMNGCQIYLNGQLYWQGIKN